MTLAALVFTVASLHLNDSRDYNQFNPGIGLVWSAGNTFTSAGAYLNSSARLSVYGSIGHGLFRKGPVIFGVEGGVITGYSVPVLPVAFPFVAVANGRYVFKAMVLPTSKPVVGFQVIRSR